MSAPPAANAMLAKALQACRSAAALLAIGDADGACNRAYYAMFDAASAALLVSGQSVPRTHGGVINAFSLSLVKDGPVPEEMDRALKRAEEMRILADYTGDCVEIADARALVEQSQEMLTCIHNLFFAAKDGAPK